jgi:hypothetical protein
MEDSNSASPKLSVSLQHKLNNSTNFLDITIARNIDSIQFSIHRKSTTTDTMIPTTSCYPPEQKYSTIRYFLNRIKCYTLEQKKKQISIVDNILHNNPIPLKTTNLTTSQQKTPEKIKLHSM